MKSNALLLVAFFLLFTACETSESDLEVSVFTEEVVFTSGEKAIMTGRVLSSENVNVSDHGFHISQNEDFTNSMTISLGERSVPGRFVGETDELDIRLDYYCRTFLVENGTEKIGNVLEFSTLSPRLVDFSPKEGVQNNKVIIEGVNITSDAIILWNDQVVTPNSIVEETFIEISVPAPNDVPYAIIKVVSKGDTLVLQDRFEYIFGSWEDGGMIVDTNKNNNHIYFEDLNYFYYGLGLNREFSGPSPKIFRLDKNSLDRDVIDHSGFATEGSFYTSNGYFGGGSLSTVQNGHTTLLNNTQFFKLDGDGTTKLKDIPALLYMAVAFAHDDFVYVYGGENQGRVRNTTIFRYDIENDSWQNMGTSPYSPLNEYPYFKIGTKNYFITEDGQLFSHDTFDGEWNINASFPDEVKKDGINVVLDGHAYVGLQDISRKVFEYLPEEDRWRRKKSNSILDPSFTLGAWINNDKITIMRTNSGDGESRFFWTFDPFSL